MARLSIFFCGCFIALFISSFGQEPQGFHINGTSTGEKSSTTHQESLTSGSQPLTNASLTSGASISSTGHSITSGSQPPTNAALTTGLRISTGQQNFSSTTGSQPPTNSSLTTGSRISTTGQQNFSTTTGSQPPANSSLTTGSRISTTGQQNFSSTTGSQPPTNSSLTTSSCHCDCSTSSSTSSRLTSSTSSGSTSSLSTSSGSISSSSSGSISSSSGSTSSSSTTGSPSAPNGTECVLSYYESFGSNSSSVLNRENINLRDYHFISFGSLSANSGDIEGRVAVQNGVTFLGGFSIGYGLSSSNSFYPLIAGSLSWQSGSINPPDSHIFIAGNVDAPSYLSSANVGGCQNQNGSVGQNGTNQNGTSQSGSCLGDIFASAFSLYDNISTTLADLSDNARYSIKFSQLQLTCSRDAAIYIVTIPSSVMAQATWWGNVNCRSSAAWIININETGDVNFSGGSFQSIPENVIWNILGSGRTINVNTEVIGSILAPSNSLNQSGGVIRGKVIVGNAPQLLQVNMPNCPDNAGDLLANSFAQANESESSSIMLVPSIIFFLVMFMFLA